MRVSYIAAEMSDDFDRAIRRGAEAGVEVVSVRAKVWGKALHDLTDGEIRHMRDILKTHGVSVGTVLSPVGKCDITNESVVERHEAILSDTIQMAHELDTGAIRVFPFQPPAGSGTELDAYFDRIVEVWTGWTQIAEVEGADLLFEWVTSTFVQTSEQMRRVIDALDSPPHIGAIWEIDVSAQAGESPSEGYPHIAQLIRDVHIKRFGEGATQEDYATAVGLLAIDDYDGPLTVEHWGGESETLDGIRQVQALIDAGE